MALVAIAMAVLGCASPTSATKTSSAKPVKHAASPTASSDLLLVEALRQYLNNRDSAQSLALAKLAVQRAPERTDALWILLQICGGSPGCDPEPIEAQLRKLDPGNGLVWLSPLNRAMQRGDQPAANQILENIGRGQRVDLGWNGTVAKLATALSERTRTSDSNNKTPLTSGLNEMVELLSKLSLPAFQTLAESCTARRLGDNLTSARCLLVSSVLQRSDTYIAESIGLGIAQRLAASDPAGSTKVEQRIAIARYQRDSAGEIIASQVEREKFSAEMLGLMRKQRREQDVYIAIIRWSGRPLSPAPAG
jgi:hypothetical protein